MATVDNLYQIVSTYWVSSAQCIPNSQYIVTLYRMMQNVSYIIIMSNFLAHVQSLFALTLHLEKFP